MVLFAVIASPSIIHAKCTSLPLGEAPDFYLSAYEVRLRRTGAEALFKIGPVGERIMFASLGTNLRLVIRASDNMLLEVGGVLLDPAKDVDIERLKIAAAFGLGRYGEIGEPVARTIIDRSFTRLQSEKVVVESGGRSTVVLEQPESGSWVYTVGRLNCS